MKRDEVEKKTDGIHLRKKFKKKKRKKKEHNLQPVARVG